MESRHDKARALLFAVLLHGVLFAVMVLGLSWTRTSKPLSVQGGAIEAMLVTDVLPSAPQTSAKPPARPQPTPAAPPPQPKPEPRPQQADAPPQPTPQTEQPRPDTRDTERAARLAQQQAEEKARQQEQERKRQEQILLDEQRKQEEVERKERLRQQQEAREKELAEIRRQREEAEKQRKREAERLAQLEDLRKAQSAAPAPAPDQPLADRLGNQGTDDSDAGRYMLAIQQVVTSNWRRPEHVRSVNCRLRIIQIPGGEVIQATVLSPCAADDLTKRSIEAAVLRAQPLPYRGYESVFSREITFNFKYDGS